jgi:hypothetical protein
MNLQEFLSDSKLSSNNLSSFFLTKNEEFLKKINSKFEFVEVKQVDSWDDWCKQWIIFKEIESGRYFAIVYTGRKDYKNDISLKGKKKNSILHTNLIELDRKVFVQYTQI